jgi:hypothetical protein
MGDFTTSVARTLWPMTIGAAVASAAVGPGAAILTLALGSAAYLAGRAAEANGLTAVSRALLLSDAVPVYRLDTAVVADALSDGDFDQED